MVKPTVTAASLSRRAFLAQAPIARNIFAERCRMDSPRFERALRYKNNAARGGVIERIADARRHHRCAQYRRPRHRLHARRVGPRAHETTSAPTRSRSVHFEE